MSGEERIQEAPVPGASSTAAKPAWRYRITDSGGCLAEQAPVDSHVVDWKNMGREYTWTVFDFKSGAVAGWMTGVLVDRGAIIDGKYEPGVWQG